MPNVIGGNPYRVFGPTGGGFCVPVPKLQANFWDMESFYRTVFTGRLGRKHYFLSVLVFLFVGAIIIQIAREAGPGAYVLTFSVLALLKTVLDAKRLRDVMVPGKVAPIAVLLFLLAWAPFSYDLMTGAILPFSPMPRFLSLMGIFLFVAHGYLLLAKGDREKRAV